MTTFYKSKFNPAIPLLRTDPKKNSPTLEEMWRASRGSFHVAVLFVSASGQVLVSRQPDETWSLPTRQGFGPRMDYDSIVGRIASPLGLTCSALQLVPLCEYKGTEHQYALISAFACDQRFWQREHVLWISPDATRQGIVLDDLARVGIGRHLEAISNLQAA